MKFYKNDQNDRLEVGQIYYTKKFSLAVDRSLCRGCMLCELACPRAAITVTAAGRGDDGREKTPQIDIDETRCDYHGICAVVCPFGAIEISSGGSNEIPAVSKGVFPHLTRDIAVDCEKCAPDCQKCEEVCPVGIVSVRCEDGKTAVQIERERCAGCLVCWVECPTEALSVSKFIEGSIQIQEELCPDGCHSCLDVCPVRALDIEDGKVYANNMICIYCGACQKVCPVPEALSIERTSIQHSPVNSGAWNKALEKLTSADGLNRELSAERQGRAKEAVQNLEL